MTVTDAQTRAHADIMAGRLARCGWDIVAIDIQWYEPNAAGFDDRRDAKLEIDAWGRLIPAAGGKEGSCTDAARFFLQEYVRWDKRPCLHLNLRRQIGWTHN
jgi:hypothetical protein